jgi:hypothetical protein
MHVERFPIGILGWHIKNNNLNFLNNKLFI